jgi:NADH-quinone oxidoreductase subunit F
MPLGVKLRDLIFQYAGGLEEGRSVKAVIPGGISMPVLRGDQIDVALDHESVKTMKTLLGTAGVIVMDDRSCMVRAALVAARFFEHESCGQCTQCREGTGWLYKILKRIENGEGRMEDLETIASTCQFMEGKTICAFSDAAAWAAGNFLRQFREEFVSHIEQKGCPFTESFAI